MTTKQEWAKQSKNRVGEGYKMLGVAKIAEARKNGPIRMRRLVHISANVYWPKSVQQWWGSFASSRAIIHPTDQTKREEHNGGIDIWQIRLDK